ncbi:unnamed protein product, partial [Medioppia subpectinata]
MFVFVLGLTTILQGASYRYMIASVTTLEKRYAFGSLMSGFILIGDNISEMTVQPVLGYLAHRLHRPRLIAWCQILVGLGLYLAALPYFIYGPGVHLLDSSAGVGSIGNKSVEFCDVNRNIDEDCARDAGANSSMTLVAVFCLFMSMFFNGFGSAAYYSIGIPFIDDSVEKKNSPIYISLSACMRLMGPTLAYSMSSYVLTLYENPLMNPGISTNDPRWLGAWWIGFIILATCIILCSLPLFLFPNQLIPPATSEPANKTRKLKNPASDLKMDLWSRLMRLANNPIYVFILIGTTIRLLGVLGYMTFKPKYIEAQYRKSASTANLFSGIIGIVPSAIGILIGGAFITYLKPGAKVLTVFVMLVEILGNAGMFGAFFLGCPPAQFATIPAHTINFENTCNSNCACTTQRFMPICGPDNVTNYFSPCFAGCDSNSIIKSINGPNQYSSCGCIDRGGGGGVATEGYCPTDCGNNFETYVTLFGISNLVGTLARTGNAIIGFRIVDKVDKSFMIGVSGAIHSIFAFIPYPLVYGAVADASCKVWESKCGGERGNCWVYDTDLFRQYMHGLTIILYIIASLFDVLVVWFSARITNLYTDETDDQDFD